jgi:chromosome segregation ATPase
MKMQANKRTVFFLILSVLTFLLTGCAALQKGLEVVLKPDSTMPHQSSSMPERFQEAAPEGQTVVESAIELYERCARLSEEKSMLQQEKQGLVAENRQLKNHIAISEPELKQTKKELDQANDLLIDMTTELNNWKMNILGFRDEMRDADTEQLRALLKILELLGGEVKTEFRQDQDSAVSPDKRNQPQPRETLTSGEPNE